MYELHSIRQTESMATPQSAGGVVLSHHGSPHVAVFDFFFLGGGRPFCKTVRPMLSDRCLYCLSSLSVCRPNVGVLWSNGWMDQDETRQGGSPRPRHTVLEGDFVRWGSSFPQKGHSPLSAIFGHVLWPNGWMDQYAI